MTIALALAAALTVSPPSIDFGTVLVQSYASDTLTITNTAKVPIVLGEVTVNHPWFNAGSRSGGVRPGTSIAPNGVYPLAVWFRPEALGAAAGTLVISNSDPAAPEIFVPLSGAGAVPEISVLPDSIALTLAAGDSASRTLTIANGGTVDLAWSIAFVPSAGVRGGDLAGVAILWDRSHGQQGSSFWSTVVGDLEDRGATVTESAVPITADVLDDVHILWSQDASQAWSADERQVLEDWVLGGGGLLLEGDNPSSIPIFNAITSEIGAGIQYASHSGGQGLTTTIFPHVTTENVDRIDVGLHQAKLTSITGGASEVVRDPSEAPVAAVSRVGAGRIVALSDELFQDAVTGTGRDNRLFGNQAIEWLAGASWISASPSSGVIEPDSSRIVTLAIDTAELPAGEHRLDATIASNDPNQVEVAIPVTLTLTGRPDIDVTPPALSFGSVVVLQSQTDSVAVWNAGEELLTIASIGIGAGAFSTTTSPASLAPSESLVVAVTFVPSAIGPASGTLTITSDDPDEPTVLVALSGSGMTDCKGACDAPSIDAPNLAASNGVRLALPILIAGSTAPIGAFGFKLEFDSDVIAFGDSSAAGGLTEDFVLVSAQETSPGVVQCGGFGTTAIPAGSTGELMRVFLEVDCATCIPGDESSLVITGLTDDLVGVNACCGTFSFATCSRNGDVNQDGQLSPGDALCAIKIFLNGQIVPAECDVSGTCEVVAADANCDSAVTAGDAQAIYDAYLAGELPYPCFAQGGGAPSEKARLAVDAMLREGVEASSEGAFTLAAGPTPSAGSIEIDFSTPATGERTAVRVVDVAGRVVRSLFEGPSGERRRLEWDGRDTTGLRAAAGIYFVRLEQGATSQTRRIVLLR